MSDPRYIVTTFRVPKEVHGRAKSFIKKYNESISWDEKKLTLTVLVGRALDDYLDRVDSESLELIESKRV